MNIHAQIPKYIKLSSDCYLSMDIARQWFKMVLANAPMGIMTTIDSMDLNGYIVPTRMIRRTVGDEVQLIIPLTRDLLPDELQKLSAAWQEISPPGRFSLSTNPTQDQKLRQAVDEIKIDNSDYQSLCLQLAKLQHDIWVKDKAADGWHYGTLISIRNKTHPLMLPWDQLPTRYKDINSTNPQNFLNLINNQGYTVVRQEELGSLLKLLRSIE